VRLDGVRRDGPLWRVLRRDERRGDAWARRGVRLDDVRRDGPLWRVPRRDERRGEALDEDPAMRREFCAEAWAKLIGRLQWWASILLYGAANLPPL